MGRVQYYANMAMCRLKMLTARASLHLFHRDLLKKDIWLFQEKHTEARDNGYHLYKYVKEHHPEVNAYYTIVKGSPDEKKISKYGATIEVNSPEHYLYWLAAKYSINSQPYGAAPVPREWHHNYRHLGRKDQKVVFLQHGITKDQLPGLHYDNTHFDLFTCSAVPELEYVRTGLGYPDPNAQLLGLCRFDNLSGKTAKKQILIMPTFRKWLVSANVHGDASESECAKFTESDFYKQYYSLLTNEDLLRTAREYGYKIVFYMHYSLQSYTKTFAPCSNDTVVIADRINFDVQQLLIDSAVMVTDFSSVFFDFAYMAKPEVFFQFDEDKYRGSHYQEGYFDYRRDGFGPVYTKSADVINYLDAMIKNGCHIEPEYLDRIDSFFSLRDDHNCERTYEAIKNLR